MTVHHPSLSVTVADPRLLRRTRLTAICCWSLAAATTAAVLAGWKCPPSLLAKVLGGTEMMRPITLFALAFGLGAVGILLFARTPRMFLAARAAGVAVVTISIVGMCELLSRFEHGLSHWAFLAIGEQPGAGLAPWMAPNVSLCLALLGFAIVRAPPDARRGSRASQWFGIAGISIAALALLGYTYGVRSLFQFDHYTAMAVPSAIALGALAIGVICSRCEEGPLAKFLAPTLAGYALRRLLPAVVIIPSIIGWLLLHAHSSEILELEFATAVFAVSNVLLFAAIIIGVIRQMALLEQQLDRQRAINRTLIETTPAPLLLLDADTRITLANREVEPLFGWKPEELLGRRLQSRFVLGASTTAGADDSPLLHAVREGRALRDHEEIFRAKDGHPVEVLCATTPMRDEDGSQGAIILALDVTSRNRALREQRRVEERFAIISGITNDIIWDWNIGDQSIWWNQRIETFAGPTPDAVPQTLSEWMDRIHPEDRPRVERSILEVIESGGREWAGEYRYRRHDGELRFVSDHGRVIRDGNGRAMRMLGGMTDITERKQAEESLHLAVRRFETLANLIPQFVWSSDPDGHFDFFNERWYEFTGMSRDGDQGWNWKNHLHPDDLSPATDAWRRSLETGEPFKAEYRFRRASDGAYVWFMGRAVPIRDSEGRISRWFGTCTDIDDQRRAGEKLEALVRQRTAQLRESIADLEHFSYTLTHDMRAPLRAMQGYAYMLLADHAAGIDPQGLDFLRRIMAAADRMDHLILDALNYSKVVKSELPLTPVPTGPLLGGLVESYPEFQSPATRIELIDPLPVVLGNISGLTQCFSNLLGNAVKFVRHGERPHVRVWSEDRGTRVRIWFEDNGIGIDPSHREKIFQMFERLDPSYEGTGVGLALVRKVVERMRGHVGVEAAPQGGSRFWIELLKPADTDTAW